MSPTDLAILGADYSTDIETSADPAAYVIEACGRARAWLAHVLEHGDIEQIVELKSQAEAIRVYTMSKQLGKDAQLSAAEIVRRAERGIGLAVRKGQAAGEFRSRQDPPPLPSRPYERVRNGQQETVKPPAQPPVLDETKRSPKEFFGSQQECADVYAMTDGITDGEFNAIIAEAKAEGSLARKNVVRKARAKRDAQDAKAAALVEPTNGHGWVPDRGDRTPEASLRRRTIIREMAESGHTSRQMSDRIGVRDDRVRQMAREMGIKIPADEVTARTRRIDSNRIVRETAYALDGLAMGVQHVNIAELDPAETVGWASSMTDSIRVLNRLVKALKEAA